MEFACRSEPGAQAMLKQRKGSSEDATAEIYHQIIRSIALITCIDVYKSAERPDTCTHAVQIVHRPMLTMTADMAQFSRHNQRSQTH